MFSYQQNKWEECYPCTPDIFKRITQAPATIDTIRKVREELALGHIKEARSIKSKLPGFMYQAKEVLPSVGVKDYNKDRRGRWRLQNQCILNGLVMCDFDHVTNPRERFKEITSHVDLKELGICLMFITPGGEGLKSVHKARKEWGPLVTNQKQMAKLLGLTPKIDKSCRDSSRLSFAPQWDDILFIDEETLFNYDNPEYDEAYGLQYRQGNTQGTIDFDEADAGATDSAATIDMPAEPALSKPEDLGPIKFSENDEGVKCYHGVPYVDIVAKWNELKGGRPKIGDRHQRMLELAGELRRIVDNKPANVFWLMQQTCFYQEMIDEGRLKELLDLARDVCKYRPRGSMTDELAQTLDSFGIKYTRNEASKSVLPYDDWADRLMTMKLGCYEPAVAHIDNPLVRPGGVLSASGMYSTLLTRCDYQNWKGDMQRLNSLVLLCGEPGSGKSVARDQDDHIMLNMRLSDKPARDAEKAYKREKHARETSSKAQKGEPLQEPSGIIRYNVVKVSNNRFYHHAENNVETGYNGEEWFLHQYMFSTELLSLVNAKGGFQEKRDIILQSFHNERNGVDYANSDSVNNSMPMMFSGVFTCTRTSLQQFINARNIGDGMSTRFTSWLMPEDDYHTDEYRSERREDTAFRQMEAWGARFDALKCEIKGLEPLVRHVYDLCAALAEEARINEDKVLNLERKRLQDKVMAVCIPQVISTQPSWSEFVSTSRVKIEQHHLDFADLMCEVINTCEDALFGKLLQEMFDNEANHTVLRRVYDKSARYYTQLSDEFSTQDVMRIWGYSSITTASHKCQALERDHIIEKLGRGRYRKIATTI